MIKKLPSEALQTQLGVGLLFKGLMASESRSRAINFLTRGYLFQGARKAYLHDERIWHCQPLAVWTEEDIWAYIHRFNVPYSSLYDISYVASDETCAHIRRNGCLGCATDFAYRDNHLSVLRQTHPKAWSSVMRAGMAEEIRKLQVVRRRTSQRSLFDLFSSNELLEMQPCAFDGFD